MTTSAHDELRSRSVAELRRLARARGLSATGRKADLIERLAAREPAAAASGGGWCAYAYAHVALSVLAFAGALVRLALAAHRADTAGELVDRLHSRLGGGPAHRWCEAAVVGGEAGGEWPATDAWSRTNALDERPLHVCCDAVHVCLAARRRLGDGQSARESLAYFNRRCETPAHRLLAACTAVDDAAAADACSSAADDIAQFVLDTVDAAPRIALHSDAAHCPSGKRSLFELVIQWLATRAISNAQAQRILATFARKLEVSETDDSTEIELLSQESDVQSVSSSALTDLIRRLCASRGTGGTVDALKSVINGLEKTGSLQRQQVGCLGSTDRLQDVQCIRAAARCETDFFRWFSDRFTIGDAGTSDLTWWLLFDAAYVSRSRDQRESPSPHDEIMDALLSNIALLDGSVGSNPPTSVQSLLWRHVIDSSGGEAQAEVLDAVVGRALQRLAVAHRSVPIITLMCDTAVQYRGRYLLYTPKCRGDRRYEYTASEKKLQLRCDAPFVVSQHFWNSDDASLEPVREVTLAEDRHYFLSARSGILTCKVNG